MPHARPFSNPHRSPPRGEREPRRFLEGSREAHSNLVMPKVMLVSRGLVSELDTQILCPWLPCSFDFQTYGFFFHLSKTGVMLALS